MTVAHVTYYIGMFVLGAALFWPIPPIRQFTVWQITVAQMIVIFVFIGLGIFYLSSTGLSSVELKLAVGSGFSLALLGGAAGHIVHRKLEYRHKREK